MPVKSQQRAQTDHIRTRDRSNMLSNNVPKTATTTAGRRVLGQMRPGSGETQTTLNVSVVTASHTQDSLVSEPLKIITEVDETNIDEVLSLPDLSGVPTAFLTEIQQDAAYETIYQELQKKIPHTNRSSLTPPATLSVVVESDEQTSLSPHVLIVESENDVENNINDEVSSTTSNNDSLSSSPDGYDTDIETEIVTRDDHDITGRTQYRESCIQSKVIPCSYFMAHIEDREMILRYHQFSTEDIRAIAKSLSSNLSIERLYLDGNYLQQQAAKYISQMIISNDFITELSLADNRLGGDEGTKEICKMLTLNRNLKKINLSGNKFTGSDAVQLVDAFEQNKSLRELNLSHNGFGEGCGKVLGAFISGNDTLESIDLSWNNIRGRSAIDIAHGIKENVRLKRCNLKMNGFGPDGGLILGECIKQNSSLEEFDISANRLNTPTAFAIAQALLANDSLQVLKIADNQINSDGVLAVFLCVKANDSNVLREVDFAHTIVTEETRQVCEDIVKLKDGKFIYQIGKATPNILQPNANSECYTRTNEELLSKLRSLAANAKPHQS